MVQESKEEVSLFEHHRLLRDLIDLEHPLVKLAESIDWESLEEELKEAYPSTTGHPNRPDPPDGGAALPAIHVQFEDWTLPPCQTASPYGQELPQRKGWRSAQYNPGGLWLQPQEDLQALPESLQEAVLFFMVSSLWDGPRTERKASVGYCRKLEVLDFSDIIMGRRKKDSRSTPVTLSVGNSGNASYSRSTIYVFSVLRL